MNIFATTFVDYQPTIDLDYASSTADYISYPSSSSADDLFLTLLNCDADEDPFPSTSTSTSLSLCSGSSFDTPQHTRSFYAAATPHSLAVDSPPSFFMDLDLGLWDLSSSSESESSPSSLPLSLSLSLPPSGRQPLPVCEYGSESEGLRENQNDNDCYYYPSLDSQSTIPTRFYSLSSTSLLSGSDRNAYYHPYERRTDNLKARGRKVPVKKGFQSRMDAALDGSRGTCIPDGVKLDEARDGRRYLCVFDGCRKAFKRCEHLKRHNRSVHCGDRPFSCEMVGCGRVFSRRDNLKQHTGSLHRGL